MRVSRVFAALALAALAGCGRDTYVPPPTAPAPTPTATTQAGVSGTARLIAATLPAGSTVPVMRMHDFGQQAPSLRFQGGITLSHDVPATIVQAWVRTASARCLGGGGTYSFTAGVERVVEPFSVSNTGHDPPVCALPFTTTQVEFVVLEPGTGRVLFSQSLPATYHFLAGP
jgi:predicted small lipoprotein YifL